MACNIRRRNLSRWQRRARGSSIICVILGIGAKDGLRPAGGAGRDVALGSPFQVTHSSPTSVPQFWHSYFNSDSTISSQR